MSWERMRFRDQVVWVQVDGSGRPVLDGDGRAEMKYRETDERSYRPAPANLVRIPGAELERREGGGTSEGQPSAKATGDAAAAKRTPRRAGKAAGPADLGAASADTIHVWTDGACTGNPGPMGIGVVVIATGVRHERGEFLGNGTNNIAELVAIERGLEMARALVADGARPVRVYSDSAYSIGVLSLGWKAKANQEIVARLRQLVGSFGRIGFVKVAGHAGVPENERCDELAREAITTRKTV